VTRTLRVDDIKHVNMEI